MYRIGEQAFIKIPRLQARVMLNLEIVCQARPGA
jgi:hypothetical protein